MGNRRIDDIADRRGRIHMSFQLPIRHVYIVYFQFFHRSVRKGSNTQTADKSAGRTQFRAVLEKEQIRTLAVETGSICIYGKKIFHADGRQG